MPAPAVSQSEGYNRGPWEDLLATPPRATDLETDVWDPHPTQLGVCLKSPYLWLLFPSTFALRYRIDVWISIPERDLRNSRG